MQKILIVTACALLAPSVGGAQTTVVKEWPIAAGSRARIESPVVGGERTGSVVVATSDSVVFRSASEGAQVTIPTSSIVRMDVAQGTHTRKAKGMGLGFLIGAGTGAILAAAAYKKQDCTEICIFPDSRAFDASLGGALLGIAGSVVGLIVGAHAVDTWVPVALPGR
jgi:hypothetical protein